MEAGTQIGAAWGTVRLQECLDVLRQLLSSEKLRFDETLRSSLPERPGLYAISLTNADAGAFLRAGRTVSASGGLRQRVYQNHLMGDQQGNLRTQLVRDDVCTDIQSAKDWIRRNCVVQVVVIDDDQFRIWAEDFMLAILRPKYCG